jgi:hypothetical protein
MIGVTARSVDSVPLAKTAWVSLADAAHSDSLFWIAGDSPVPVQILGKALAPVFPTNGTFLDSWRKAVEILLLRDRTTGGKGDSPGILVCLGLR